MADQENHDVIDGEIPKDLGKKKSPLWIKGLGLGVLVSLLGAATFVLNNEDNRNEVLKATKGQVENFVTANGPSTPPDMPDDEVIQSTVQVSEPNPINALEIDLTEPSQNSEINLDLAESAEFETESIPTNEEMDVAFDSENEADPRTITAPSTIEREPVSQVVDDNTVRTLSKSFASKESVEMLQQTMFDVKAQEQERINIIKTGIDMQTVSINRLNDLLKTLDGLKYELKQLSRSVPATKQKSAEHKPAPQPTNKTTAPQRQVKKARPRVESPKLVLLGVDMWGGEEFAQLQHNKQIHLLAMNESINGWRVASISTNAVTVVNEEGESFEIKN